MDKKSIIGIAVVAVLFLGFAYFNSQQQKEYLEQKAAYEAYVCLLYTSPSPRD